MDGPVHQQGIYRFEQCRLNPVSRALSRNGAPVPLRSRLFDTLLFLVQNPGRIIEREELIAAVWPARTVDDTSLPKAISSLRALLKAGGVDEEIILTVPGRGYRFGAQVVFEHLPGISSSSGSDSVPNDGVIQTPPATLPSGGLPGKRRIGLIWLVGLVVCGGMLALALLWSGQTGVRPTASLATTASAPPLHSVGVLPFVNTSGDAAQEYLSDGMSEELINALGRVSSLRVAARNSSFAFKGKAEAIQDVARRLNVADVLEGSIQRVGTRVHVTAQLVDASTGFQVWSRTYDRTTADLLAVEGQIAEEVITSVIGVLLDADLAKLALGGTNSPQAFDAYLTGMAAMGAATGAANRQAIEAFRQAITADPEYAEAYVERARAAVFTVVGGGTANPSKAEAMLNEARLDAERAVLIAPRLGAAHAVLGLVLKFQLTDLGRAADAYRQAAELAPDDASTTMSYALFQAELGHMEQALAAAQHATTLEPLQPLNHRILAEILAEAGRYDEASEALHRAQNLQPPDAKSDRIVLGLIQTYRGDMEGARKNCLQDTDFYAMACLAVADHALGQLDEANATFAKLRASVGDQGAFIFAGIYASWGQQTDALHWLQLAYELRDPGLIDLKVDPRLESIRGMTQYKDLVQRMGFPP
jgi:TolB-like protein/DNA-binding winged helix-turn-helix (wHTH) protein/tetratricopeptide (TPR) repeat protein